MNQYLLALTPQVGVRRAVLGSAMRLALPVDLTRQSPRIYNTAKLGGGILTDADKAIDLENLGFTVSPITLTDVEKSYFRDVMQAPEIASAPGVWLYGCTGKIVKETGENGSLRFVCRIPGTKEVSTLEALRDGLIDQEDLDYARSMVTAGIQKFKTYLPETEGQKPTEAEFRKALNAVRYYDQSAEMVRRLTNAVQDGVIRKTPELTAAVTAAVTLLVEEAQPVEEFKKMHPKLFAQNKNDQMGLAPAIIVAAIVVFGIIVLLGVIAVGGAVYAYLYSQESRNYTTYMEMRKECTEQAKPYLECMKDPTKTYFQRKDCHAAVKALACTEIPEAPKPPDPMGDLAKAMKYLVPVVAVGGVIYLFGPAIRESASSAAAWLRASRSPQLA
jgi:hypothetical protein